MCVCGYKDISFTWFLSVSLSFCSARGITGVVNTILCFPLSRYPCKPNVEGLDLRTAQENSFPKSKLASGRVVISPCISERSFKVEELSFWSKKNSTGFPGGYWKRKNFLYFCRSEIYCQATGAGAFRKWFLCNPWSRFSLSALEKATEDIKSTNKK